MVAHADVRTFCIQKLARILYDCVACSHADRGLFDWLAAEQFIDANKPTVDGIYDCFRAATEMPAGQDQGFETFDRICGRAVWDSLYQPLRRNLDLPRRAIHRYTHVRFG